ncbi:MAG: flagellar export chaperone FlgN [Burkholderiales bacterium]|nr:flagellar export chaperone FlgN [Phycisphaerae bacterium]
MSAPIAELEKLLTRMLAEHRLLLVALEAHQSAMKTFRIDDLAEAAEAVEASRTQLVLHEARRRIVIQQIVRLHKIAPNASLAEIADASPPHRVNLLKIRDELRMITAQITRKTSVSAKVAGTLLGHLNTVVRLIAGAVQQAAVYTKQGMPPVTARIGVMEAVG